VVTPPATAATANKPRTVFNNNTTNSNNNNNSNCAADDSVEVFRRLVLARTGGSVPVSHLGGVLSSHPQVASAIAQEYGSLQKMIQARSDVFVTENTGKSAVIRVTSDSAAPKASAAVKEGGAQHGGTDLFEWVQRKVASHGGSLRLSNILANERAVAALIRKEYGSLKVSSLPSPTLSLMFTFALLHRACWRGTQRRLSFQGLLD
jgi:hypothetical protein